MHKYFQQDAFDLFTYKSLNSYSILFNNCSELFFKTSSAQDTISAHPKKMAFETSGRYGFTPILNKIIKKNKYSNYFVALPLPLRFGNNLPTSAIVAFQFLDRFLN